MEDDKTGPTTWGAATRLFQKGEGNVTDADIFGDDPLKPKKKGDTLDYLGHFANDDVADEGHNSGKKPLGIRRMGEGAHMKQGYRVIPGNASDGYVEKKARVARDAIDSKFFGGIMAKGPINPQPVKAPLRELDRARKTAAPKAQGPLRSKKRSR